MPLLKLTQPKPNPNAAIWVVLLDGYRIKQFPCPVVKKLAYAIASEVRKQNNINRFSNRVKVTNI